MLLLPDATVHSLPGLEVSRSTSLTAWATPILVALATGWCSHFSDEDGGCFLKDPFSNNTVTLPALSRNRLRQVDAESVDEARHTPMEIFKGQKLDAPRIIFCSPHRIAAIFNFQRGGITRIAVCQPGVYSWWNVHEDDPLFVTLCSVRESSMPLTAWMNFVLLTSV
jgi:hypothetical protein